MTKVNGPKNRALVKRLNVNAYPAILYLRDGQMREYEEARSVARLAAFGRKAWRDVKPVPFYRAPNNWFGRVGGLLSRVPGIAEEGYTSLKRTHELGDVSILFLVLMVPVTLGVLCIVAADACVVRAARAEGAARAGGSQIGERRGRRRLRAVAGQGAPPPHRLLRRITTRTRSNIVRAAGRLSSTPFGAFYESTFEGYYTHPRADARRAADHARGTYHPAASRHRSPPSLSVSPSLRACLSARVSLFVSRSPARVAVSFSSIRMFREPRDDTHAEQTKVHP